MTYVTGNLINTDILLRLVEPQRRTTQLSSRGHSLGGPGQARRGVAQNFRQMLKTTFFKDYKETLTADNLNLNNSLPQKADQNLTLLGMQRQQILLEVSGRVLCPGLARGPISLLSYGMHTCNTS